MAFDCVPAKNRESELMPLRFNYIHIFCQEFYIAIVNQMTVRMAFEEARRITQLEIRKVENNKDYCVADIGVTPILVDYESSNHNDKIFDADAAPSDKRHLSKGKLYDISRATGLLVNVQRPVTAFIGQHKKMFLAIQGLKQNKLVHIVGHPGRGKTRLLQEACYYLHKRNFNKIQYEDLSQIQSVS